MNLLKLIFPSLAFISLSGTANAGFFFPNLLPDVEQVGDVVGINVVNWGLGQTVPSTGSWYFVSSPVPNGVTLTLTGFDSTTDTSIVVPTPTLTSGAFSVPLPDGDVFTLELFTSLEPITMSFELSDSPNALPDPLASATPLPATLPLFAGGLGLMGYLSRRKKRNASAPAAA